jgi:serine/threonine-protein kinase HipA
VRGRRSISRLWSRIVFNVLVSNSDDHLRNHGFIMEPGVGWRLSEAYDMNPVATASGLALNISKSDNSCDLDLVRSVAPYFRVDAKKSTQIIERSRRVVRQWQKIADRLAIGARARDRMAPAFRLAE